MGFEGGSETTEKRGNEVEKYRLFSTFQLTEGNEWKKRHFWAFSFVKKKNVGTEISVGFFPPTDLGPFLGRRSSGWQNAVGAKPGENNMENKKNNSENAGKWRQKGWRCLKWGEGGGGEGEEVRKERVKFNLFHSKTKEG